MKHQGDLKSLLEYIDEEGLMPPLGVIQVLSRMAFFVQNARSANLNSDIPVYFLRPGLLVKRLMLHRPHL
jgi:hypothetical protein